MNHGAWALTGYGMFASLLALLAVPLSWLPYGKGLLGFAQRYAPERLLACREKAAAIPCCCLGAAAACRVEF